MSIYGRTVPLSKVFSETNVNINDSAELSVLLNQIKHARLCAGFTVNQADQEYLWNSDDKNDSQTPKKRSRKCQLFISQEGRRPMCQNCKYAETYYNQSKEENEEEEEEEGEEEEEEEVEEEEEEEEEEKEEELEQSQEQQPSG